MNRMKYFQKLRRDMLERLGLPKDASPEKVRELIEKNGETASSGHPPDLSTDKRRRDFLRLIRGRVLKNMGLPEDLSPEAVSFLLRKKNR